MDEKTTRVVFADRKLEEDYRRKAASTHPEDRRTYFVLEEIRRKLRTQYLSGSEVPKNKIPRVYRRMFHIVNLWSLDLPPHGTALYSLAGKEIWIVDIL